MPDDKYDSHFISSNQFAQTLSDGVLLLEYIAQKRQSVPLATIVRDLRWDKSKTWRLLRTLYHRGFLEYDPIEKSYTCGIKVLQLYQNLAQTLEIEPRFSHKFLEDLAESTEETAFLAVLRGERVAVVDVALNSHRIGLVAHVGSNAPSFCVAHGKVFLAEMEPSSVTQLLQNSNIQAFTPQTKTDMKNILKELEQVRRQGYATENNEYEPDTWSVAAAVHDTMRVVASVGILAPASHIIDREVPELVEQVKKTAANLERRLFPGHLNRNRIAAVIRRANRNSSSLHEDE